METMVIVHGAGSGGWLWRGMRSRLWAAGMEVYTPTMTGVGERERWGTPETDLDTHVADVRAVFEYEDLHDVVLVGHSYGGMVITGVADQVPERLRRLVYLDAFVPEDGQSLFDLLPAAVRTNREQLADGIGEGWRLPPLPYPSLGRIGPEGLGEDEVRQLLTRRVGQPIRTYSQAVRLSRPEARSLPRTFIYCKDKAPGDTLAVFAEQAQEDPSWEYRELDTGHFPMLTSPRELTEVLVACIQASIPATTWRDVSHHPDTSAFFV